MALLWLNGASWKTLEYLNQHKHSPRHSENWTQEGREQPNRIMMRTLLCIYVAFILSFIIIFVCVWLSEWFIQSLLFPVRCSGVTYNIFDIYWNLTQCLSIITLYLISIFYEYIYWLVAHCTQTAKTRNSNEVVRACCCRGWYGVHCAWYWPIRRQIMAPLANQRREAGGRQCR